jgi:hypothetical protein
MRGSLLAFAEGVSRPTPRLAWAGLVDRQSRHSGSAHPGSARKRLDRANPHRVTPVLHASSAETRSRRTRLGTTTTKKRSRFLAELPYQFDWLVSQGYEFRVPEPSLQVIASATRFERVADDEQDANSVTDASSVKIAFSAPNTRDNSLYSRRD